MPKSAANRRRFREQNPQEPAAKRPSKKQQTSKKKTRD